MKRYRNKQVEELLRGRGLTGYVMKDGMKCHASGSISRVRAFEESFKIKIVAVVDGGWVHGDNTDAGRFKIRTTTNMLEILRGLEMVEGKVIADE